MAGGRPERARSVVERETLLSHPIADVFVAVMSPEIAPLIDPAVKEWAPDRRPIGVGTRFRIRGRFQWLPIRATSEVVTWDPPRCAVFEAVKPTWPLRMRAVHELVDEGGTTRYRWSITVNHPSWVGRAAIRVLRKPLEQTLEDQARTLAAWLDANPGASTFGQL